MLALGVGGVRVLGVVDLVSGAGLVLLPVGRRLGNVEEHVAAVFVAEFDEIHRRLPEVNVIKLFSFVTDFKAQ